MMHFELLRTGNKINYYVRAPGGAGIVITCVSCVYVNIKLSACVSVCPQGNSWTSGWMSTTKLARHGQGWPSIGDKILVSIRFRDHFMRDHFSTFYKIGILLLHVVYTEVMRSRQFVCRLSASMQLHEKKLCMNWHEILTKYRYNTKRYLRPSFKVISFLEVIRIDFHCHL